MTVFSNFQDCALRKLASASQAKGVDALGGPWHVKQPSLSCVDSDYGANSHPATHPATHPNPTTRPLTHPETGLTMFYLLRQVGSDRG